MKPKQTLFFFGALALLSFFLNLTWEIAHSPLYNWNQPPLTASAGFYAGRILQSSFFDMVWVVVISGLVLLFFSFKFDWRVCAIIFFALIVFSFGLEWHRVSEGAWYYKSVMPTLKDFGLSFPVGLSPLIQLAITGILSLSIVSGLTRNKNNQG